MSLIFFVQLDDAVQIITDTLVSDENRNPTLYQHKVHTFPHLDMVGAVTGFGNFGYQFFSSIDFTPGLRDIEHVNETAQAALTEMYEAWREYHAPVEIPHATVHLWGFPEGSEKVVRYIYRAKRGFEPERHEGISDFGVKPPPQQFELTAPDSIAEMIDLATKIRAENDGLRTNGPVAIGGDLFLTYMERGRTHTERIYRWADHAEIRGKMPDSIWRPKTAMDLEN